MREWWLGRSSRERMITGFGMLIAAVLLLMLVWRPLAAGTAELRGAVARKTRLLGDVQQAAAVTPGPGATVAPAAGRSLVVLVDQTAQTHGLSGALTGTRPDGTDRINVTFRDASFDALLSWLLALQTRHRISVEVASVTGARQPGLVNGQLLLSRQ